MPDMSPSVAVQAAEVNALNFKALFDGYLQKTFAQAQLPNAWELLSQRLANDAASLSNRTNNNAASFDFALKSAIAYGFSTAMTENQQTVSPAGTAASETTKGTVAAAGAGEAVAAQGVATGSQAIADALATFVAGISSAATNFAQAATAILATAAGGASTPSQTQPKPATS